MRESQRVPKKLPIPTWLDNLSLQLLLPYDKVSAQGKKRETP